MKFVSQFSLWIALFCISLSVCADPLQLTLQDCIRLALTRNPAIHSAWSDVRANEARIVEAHAGLEPNISLFYNATRQFQPLGPPLLTPFGNFQPQAILFNTYRDGISLNQLLFDGQKTASQVRGQEAVTDASHSDYQLTIQSTVFNTIQSFYQVIVDRELVGVSEENLKDAQEHYKLASARFKAGVAPRSEVVFAKVPVATAELDLTRAKQVSDNAEAALNRLISFEVTTPLNLKRVDDRSLVFDVKQDDAFREALKYRYEITRAESLVKSAREQVNAAQALYAPVVNASAGYGYTDYGTNFNPQNRGYNVGVQGTFSIFNGNLQSAQVAEAKASLDKNLAMLDAAHQDVMLDVQQAYVAFQSAKVAINQADVALASALENQQMTEGEYKAGVVPILNLIDAETGYIQAKTQDLNALLSYETALARLFLAMGKNLEKFSP